MLDGLGRPDGAIFTSLPRSGQVNAAQVLAEWGDWRQAHAGPDSRRNPQRGHPGHQRIRLALRRALPLGLQQAVRRCDHHVRRQQPPRQPLATKIYNDARAVGKDHQHAIRILARAWIRVTWRCWVDSIPYDPPGTALAEQSAIRLLWPDVDTGSVMIGPPRLSDRRAVPAARHRPPPMTGGCDPRPSAGPRQAGAAGTRRAPVPARVPARR